MLKNILSNTFNEVQHVKPVKLPVFFSLRHSPYVAQPTAFHSYK